MMRDEGLPMPVEAAAKKKKKKAEGGKKKPAEGPVRTQMLPENPADQLGYDPSIIPTEKI